MVKAPRAKCTRQVQASLSVDLHEAHECEELLRTQRSVTIDIGRPHDLLHLRQLALLPGRIKGLLELATLP